MMARVIRRRAGAAPADFGRELHPVVRRVYAARGLTSSLDLALGLDQLLPVSSLDGLDAAIEVLLEHLAARTRVLVVGDFDADGATSSALVVRTLRRLGFSSVGYLVPNRFRYGYGLTPEIVAVASEQSPGLIVTVDNGISSHSGVAEATRRGIDVLITDHHLPAAALPAARAIVNPNLAGARFASHALAGVGVAFYVLAALVRRLQAARLGRRRWVQLGAISGSGRAGHGRGPGASRSQQPHSGVTRSEAHPRWALCAGDHCASRAGESDALRNRCTGPGLCGRSAAQRRREAR